MSAIFCDALRRVPIFRLQWLLACLSPLVPLQVSGSGLDAVALGRGGTASLHRLDRSPAAPVSAGFSVQVGAGWHFLGSGLVSQHLQLIGAGNRAAWSLSADWMRSDVHREQEIVSALQLRHEGARLGLACGWREWRFPGHESLRDPVLRLGIGAQAGQRWQTALVADWLAGSRGDVRFTVGARGSLDAGLDVILEVEREPALPTRLRASLEWGPAAALGLLCGYDAVTSSFSGGVVVRTKVGRVVCAAASHPDLGWSRACLLEWQR